MDEATILSMRANPRFLIREFQRRGIETELIDYSRQLYEARLGSHREILLDIFSSINSVPTSQIGEDKITMRAMLQRANVPIPKGRGFSPREIEEAMQYSSELCFPVVVKPVHGSGGQQVHLGIENAKELREVLSRFVAEADGLLHFVVEQQAPGEEYRVFITRERNYAVLRVEAASVVGDGIKDIKTLAEEESFRRMNPRTKCSGAIVLDRIAEDFLRRQGRSFSTIPSEGQKIFVRPNSNVMTGGLAYDCTDEVHASLIALAESALAALAPSPFAGVDIMSVDPTVPQTEENAVVLEVNTLPGIGVHMAPSYGASRDVAAMIADLIFPETCRSEP